MKVFFFLTSFALLSACSHVRPIHHRTSSESDDRKFNPQSQRFESREDATGLEATRRLER